MHPDRIDQESSLQSQYSPSVVSNSEELIRVGYDPEDIHEGYLIPAKIKTADLKERGYSVFRQSFSTEQEMRYLADAQMAKSPELRRLPYVSSLSTISIRKITIDLNVHTNDEESLHRALVVLDDGLLECRGHAIILASQDFTRGIIKEIKNKIADVVSKTVILE